MSENKSGQISIEYLVVIGFVTLLIIVLLGIAFFYTNGVQDQIKERQLEDFVNKVVSSADAVAFAGSPSKVTINAFLPEGITDISINEKDIVFTFGLSSGTNVRSFDSDVSLSGSISAASGTKTIQLTAQDDGTVLVSSN